MSDLAIIYNQAIMQYDIAMNGPDLLLDNGLKTGVILLLDRDILVISSKIYLSMGDTSANYSSSPWEM